MTDTLTAHYNLVKIEYNTSSDTWGTKTNTNLDLIDTALNSLNTAKQPLNPFLTQLSTCDPHVDRTFIVAQSGAWYVFTAGDVRYFLGLGDMALASTANYRNNTANDARYLQNDPGFGAVGSLALVRYAVPGSDIGAGSLVSASSLRAVGLYWQDSPGTPALQYVGNAPLAGTWRMMGDLTQTNNTGGTVGFGIALAQRVA